MAYYQKVFHSKHQPVFVEDLMFREQFKMTKRRERNCRYLYIYSIVVCQSLVNASSAPSAPLNDLEFIHKMDKCKAQSKMLAEISTRRFFSITGLPSDVLDKDMALWYIDESYESIHYIVRSMR